MNKTVIWSGGCDSTLVLFEEIMNHTSGIGRIQALSFVHSSMDANKMKAEQIARSAFKQKIEQLGWADRVEYAEIMTTASADIGVYLYGCPQIVLWLCLALLHIENDTELMFGYIRKDDFWHYINDVRIVVEHAANIMGKTVKLSFPKEWESKEAIIRSLKQHSIYECTWYCEDPHTPDPSVLVPCGSCLPCTTHSEALRIVNDSLRIEEEAVQAKKEEVEQTVPDKMCGVLDSVEKSVSVINNVSQQPVTECTHTKDDSVIADVVARLMRAGAQHVDTEIIYEKETGNNVRIVTFKARI